MIDKYDDFAKSESMNGDGPDNRDEFSNEDIQTFFRQLDSERLNSSEIPVTEYIPAKIDLVHDLEKELDQRIELGEKEQLLKAAKIEKAFNKYEIEKRKLDAVENFELNSGFDISFSNGVESIGLINVNDSKEKKALEKVFGPYLSPSKHNLIAIMGNTNSGKSTIASEVVLGFYSAKCVVVYISNEEDCQSIFIRTAAMSVGLPIKNTDQYTAYELEQIKKEAILISKYVKVFDDFSIRNAPGILSTPEGVKSFFEKIELYYKNKSEIKGVVFDYYQGVLHSSAGGKKEYEAQEMLVQVFEDFRNRVGIPLYVLGQLYDRKGTFQERIKGSKSILFRATCAVELISDKKNNSTQIVIHKSRFEGSSCESILCLKMRDSRLCYQGRI